MKFEFNRFRGFEGYPDDAATASVLKPYYVREYIISC